MRYVRILCMCVIQLLLSAAAFAQTQVTGHVADVRGDDIIGANVTVKGTSNGTITDIDGNFTINVDSKNAALAISFIGYKTKEVKVDGKTHLQIVLEEDTDCLLYTSVSSDKNRLLLHILLLYLGENLWLSAE